MWLPPLTFPTRQNGPSDAANGESFMKKAKKQQLPRGWTEKRVRKLAEYYDNQTEDEQAAEIEAAWDADNLTMVAVPTELVPEVLRVLARKRRA